MATPERLTEKDYQKAAKSLGCDVATIKAVAEVESSGDGFLNDGRLRLLFEGHQFHKFTKGAFKDVRPDLCHPRWTTANYCRGPAEVRGAGEFQRFLDASKLDKRAARMSCSIGKFQVMGFNFALCGFKTVDDFWEALGQSEANQLDAFCCYVRSVGLEKELKTRNWAEFARRYNGPEYKKNKYDEKLAKAYAKHSAQQPSSV